MKFFAQSFLYECVFIHWAPFALPRTRVLMPVPQRSLVHCVSGFLSEIS